MMYKDASRYLFLVLISIVTQRTVAIADTASSLNDNSSEIWTNTQTLQHQTAFDTTPIEFTYYGIKYRVPRNYMTSASFSLPTFKVTFPGFQPLTEKTEQCLTRPRAFWPPGCAPVQFWLEGRARSANEDRCANQFDRLHGQVPKHGPAGFEFYETGPEYARSETYFKRTSAGTLCFDCFTFIDHQGKRDGVCSNYFSPLSNGDRLSYRIDLDQISNAEKIDDGIRSLIATFTVGSGEP